MLPAGALTRNFALREFNSRDGAHMPPEAVNQLLALCTSVLEPIRVEWGDRVSIVSGWRSAGHNIAIGGAPLSQHLVGKAADIAPSDMFRVDDFRTMVVSMITRGRLPLVGGYGLYPDWIHVDIRDKKPNGKLYTWLGKGFGAEAQAA